MNDLFATLEKHKPQLLSLPGCTGVAIGRKVTAGKTTDQLAIVVFFEKKKKDVAPNERVPGVLDAVPTDVVEKTFGLALTSTDPFERFDQLFSGISITARDSAPAWGTLGCIIRTTGNLNVPPGDYLLTNQHVLLYADPNNPNSKSRQVIQPGRADWPAPANYSCGDYVYGQDTLTSDCAIATIGYGRTWRNEVPNHPWHWGRRDLAGVAAAAVGDEVYKYGATTQSTRGIVQFIHFNAPNYPIQNAIYVIGVNGDMWVAKGDSGSVLIRYADDYVVGLNFAADETTLLPPDRHPALPDDREAYSAGYAYDAQLQMNVFGGVVTLAPNP